MASSIHRASESIIKNPYQIGKIEFAARGLYQLFADLRPFMRPGMTGTQLAHVVETISARMGLTCSLLAYQGFPAVCCINAGKIIAHGIPSSRAFNDGELITLDLVLSIQGWHADASWTYAVGSPSIDVLTHRSRAWQASIAGARAAGGGSTGITAAVQAALDGTEAYVLPQFLGHGIGRDIHEAPRMSYVAGGDKCPLPSGSVFTVEPLVLQGGNSLRQAQRQANGEWIMEPPPMVAQFEVMVAMEGRFPRIIGMPQAWQQEVGPPF